MAEAWTVGRLLEWTTPYFKQRGIDSARLDAELLLAHSLGLSRLALYTGYDRPVGPQELDAYRALVQRRAKHEPVAYLLGKKGFHEIELEVDRRVLVPRPETELVVERALALFGRSTTPRFADIGTGSGAIALALLHALPHATAVATDISDDALAVAADNARALGLSDRLTLRHGAFFVPLAGERFDAIVSNPPYIADGTPLDADVVDFEPHQALFSGPDGRLALDTLIAGARDALVANGFFCFELGIGQGADLCIFAERQGYAGVCLSKDSNGIDRVLEGRAKV